MTEPSVEFWLITYHNLTKVELLLNSFRACSVSYLIKIFDNSCDASVEQSLRSMLRPGELLYVSSENLYCCGASQALLQTATAPYVAYVCATHTEINDPQWVVPALELMEQDPKVAMAGHLREMSGLYYYQAIATGQPNSKKPIPEHLPLLEDHFTRTEIFENANHHIHVQGGAWVARREALLACGGFETSIKHTFMDVELAVRLQCYGWKLAQVPNMYSEYWGGRPTPDHAKYAICHYYRES